MQESVRLQKYMADNGIASRPKSEELIAEGRVKVNGRVAQIGDKIDPKHDVVSVNGRKIVRETGYVYLALNKPRGYVTTMSDEMDRKCVAELVADVGKRVYPVGRLDRDSEGLLLITNDGEFANAMTHPSRHIAKTYRVSVRPKITEDQITVLTSSMPVTLRGARDTLDALSAGRIRISADLSNISGAHGNYTVPALIEISGDPDVGVIGSYEVTVHVGELEPEEPTDEPGAEGSGNTEGGDGA